jgi:4-hydroxybutyrate dehydrogenase
MFSFKLPTAVSFFESIDEFIDYVKVEESDLLITNRVIYEQFKRFNVKCRIIFQEDFGVGEPSDRMINSILRELGNFRYNRVLAIGGGTVIDVAKILSLSGIKNVLDALYGRIPLTKGHKLLVIPTTCGTGSEVTNIAILEDTEAHVKKGIVGPAVFPDEAILVPELLTGLPYKFFAFSSIDALIHAIESYLAPTSNIITEMFADKAIKNILAAYRDIAKEGPEALKKNMAQVLIASTFAGIAFGNTGVGAVHAMSYPLGGKYHVPHGEANYAFLDVVLQKYASVHPDGKITKMRSIIAESLGLEAVNQTFSALNLLLNQIMPLKQIREYGVQESELELFAQSAMAQERLMKNNYVCLSFNDILEMYKSRF